MGAWKRADSRCSGVWPGVPPRRPRPPATGRVGMAGRGSAKGRPTILSCKVCRPRRALSELSQRNRGRGRLGRRLWVSIGATGLTTSGGLHTVGQAPGQANV